MNIIGIVIRVIQSGLAIWLMISIYKFSRTMTKEDTEDVKGVKLNLFYPVVLICLAYFGTLLAVGMMENPKLFNPLATIKHVIMAIQFVIIILYPILTVGELSTRMLGFEITGAPSSEKRTRNLLSNVRVLVFLTFVISNIVYIIL